MSASTRYNDPGGLVSEADYLGLDRLTAVDKVVVDLIACLLCGGLSAPGGG